MSKTLIPMEDLRARALAEIRKQPGCSSVRNIAINHVTDDRAESNWSLCVVSVGAADANTAARAAIYVQHLRSVVSLTVEPKMALIDFDYDLAEIVQMAGVGAVSLKSALKRIPDPVGPYGVLHREPGKTPAFFDTFQIQALLNRHRSQLNEGNPPGHREADEDDF